MSPAKRADGSKDVRSEHAASRMRKPGEAGGLEQDYAA